MRRSIIAALALGAGLGVAGAASAETTYTTAVPYNQADLATPQTISALHQRVVDAAEDVCRQASRGAYDRATAVTFCKAEAVRVALEGAGLDALSAYHEEEHALTTRAGRTAARGAAQD